MDLFCIQDNCILKYNLSINLEVRSENWNTIELKSAYWRIKSIYATRSNMALDIHGCKYLDSTSIVYYYLYYVLTVTCCELT